MWVRVTKAANSTVSATLWAAMGQAGDPIDNSKRSSDKVSRKSSFIRPSALTKKQVAELSNNYKKIIFVRNPYTRVLSAYLDKGRISNDLARKFSNYDGEAGTRAGFEGFCRYLANGGVYEDPHWYPQNRLCPFPSEELDFVGKMENLNSDLNRLLDWLGLPAQDLVRAGPKPTGASGRIAEFYSEESEQIIKSLYSDDFRMFGYSENLQDA
ncbi:sulfotransferase family protein [Halorhodospira halochloris]|nr:sulfotransferase family protein [Halorhodospira halochloris]